MKKLNLSFLLAILLSFIIGWQVGHRDFSLFSSSSGLSSQPPAGVNLDFKLFWQTWDLLSKEYVDKKALDPQKMYYGAIQGMVAAVGDPYTVFLPPSSQKNIKEELNGSFEGVGIELGFDKNNHLAVISPLQGTPADKAGIKPGDLILKVNGKDTTTMSLPDAVDLIRGPKGTKVSLQILHEGSTSPNDVSLDRDTIIVKSVEYSQKTTPSGKKIGYIKLSRFGENTESEWNDAVSKALNDSPDGIVLDLRNNPGGFLDAAVFIGSELIDSGDIVIQENGAGQRQEYKVNRAGKLLKQPLVVLINKGSASASEIVAGAVQDHKRGQLVGEQSFGKGTIQEAQDLPGGTGIHVTTAKWLTPNGRWIHNTGLTPDVNVARGDDPVKDPQLDKALEILDNSK